MSKKIVNHIDSDYIITALGDGESVRSISAEITKRHPDDKSKHVSAVTLQKFRKEKMQLDGKVLKDIQEADKALKVIADQQEIQDKLEQSDAYRKKINEIAGTKLDVARKILQLDAVIEARMEYWFNMVATSQVDAASGDKELRQFMDRQMLLLGQYKKFVEGMADKTIDHNININVFNDQIVVVRDVIVECIADFDPERAALFMETLNSRLSVTDYTPQRSIPESVAINSAQEVGFEEID